MVGNPNSSKPLNPYAPPFPSKAVVLPPMLPRELCQQQFQVITTVPAIHQPAVMPLGYPCPPGQHMWCQTSVTISPPFHGRDAYRVCAQPFSPANNASGGRYCTVEEQFVPEKAAIEKKLLSSAKSSVSRRKYVNGRRVLLQKKWCTKKPAADIVPLPSSSSGVPESEKEMCKEVTTSVMIKNIPNQIERGTLLNILDEHCRQENVNASSGAAKPNFIRSEFDFLYLPMDFRRGANKGYAFVNFTTAVAASRFSKAFEGHCWQRSGSRKICQVTIAEIQGKDALQNHFKNSAFSCRKDSYLPVVFSPPRDGLARTPPTSVGRRV